MPPSSDITTFLRPSNTPRSVGAFDCIHPCYATMIPERSPKQQIVEDVEDGLKVKFILAEQGPSEEVR